ncbi:MAG: hypothetical protein WCF84_11770 [Anaerolineae bacterium]
MKDTAERARRKPAWFFYPGWVVLTAISIPIAFFIAMAIMSPIVRTVGDTIVVGGQRHITEDFLPAYILVPVLGLLTGSLQYLLLRLYLPRMGWWIAVTFVGWLLPFAILSFLFSIAALPGFTGTAAMALSAVVYGGSIGLAQWLLLRRRVRRAYLWILGCMLGWGVAFLVVGESISNTPDIVAVALIPPAVACFAWWLLLDKLAPHESNGGNTPRNTALATLGSTNPK